MIDFKNIDYLKDGNIRQQLAYREIGELKLFENLKNYNPVLAGTIPLEIDIPESDLDIICECENHTEFSNLLRDLFENYNSFELNTNFYKEIQTTVARFQTTSFHIEIFGQNIPVEKQNAYRHMLIEYQILKEKGPIFR